jgi:hypothetical protein
METQAATDIAGLFIELGGTVVGLALLARLVSGWGSSAIPCTSSLAWHLETAPCFHWG